MSDWVLLIKELRAKYFIITMLPYGGKKNKHKEEHLISGHKRNFLNKKKITFRENSIKCSVIVDF